MDISINIDTLVHLVSIIVDALYVPHIALLVGMLGVGLLIAVLVGMLAIMLRRQP